VIKRPEKVCDKVNKVVIINENLPWESVPCKVPFEENRLSFLEVGHHGVPTNDGNPWILSRNVFMAFSCLFNSLFDSFNFSVEKVVFRRLRKVVAVMIHALSHFTFDVVK